MTNSQKIERWQKRLLEARKDLEREAQWMGVRLGAFAATKKAEKRFKHIEFQIQKLQLAEHVAGNCDPSNCSDCDCHKRIPDDWPERGSNIEAELVP